MACSGMRHVGAISHAFRCMVRDTGEGHSLKQVAVADGDCACGPGEPIGSPNKTLKIASWRPSALGFPADGGDD